MKTIYYILVCLLLVFMTTSCQDNEINKGIELKKGESLFTVTFPEPVAASTRNMGEANESTIKNLNVLVFDEVGYFVANMIANPVAQTTATGGTYTVSLPISNSPRRLHFIANYKTGNYTAGDTESSIFGSMKTSGDEDAYWGMVEVDEIPADGFELGTIELVRNFAKISISSAAITDFELLGYYVCNKPNEGLVAPYNLETGKFANFISFGSTYIDFTKANPDYKATTVGGIDETVPTEEQFIVAGIPSYVYERNQDDSEIPTSVILRASYGGEECYYKIDLVQVNSETYETITYNLLRNFHYQINITSVQSAGYKTVSEAMYAAASNNLSASIAVSKVTKVSDGIHTLEVSTIDTLIVSSEPFSVRFNYTEKEASGSDISCNDKVKVTFIPAKEESKIFDNMEVDQANGIISLTPKSQLPALIETQEIVVAAQSGLNRRIVIRGREPFEFVATDCQQVVKGEINAPFTFITELPAGMPTQVFPLTLQLDMGNNTLYPDASRNQMPVELTNNRDYIYNLKVDYNTYRQNRTIYCHFLTNTANSVTTIKAKGDYFKESDEETFKIGQPLEFTDIRFNGVSYSPNGATNSNLTVPYGTGQKVTLEFKMNRLENEFVRIFTRYLIDPETTTGRCEPMLNIDGSVNGYLYEPNDENEPVQIITFKTKGEIAAETIELFSDTYAPVLIPYTNPYAYVKFMATNGSATNPINGTVKVYLDRYYQDYSADLQQTNGQTIMRSFAGNTPSTILYFLYTNEGRTYRGEAPVSHLIQGIQGNPVEVNLKVR